MMRVAAEAAQGTAAEREDMEEKEETSSVESEATPRDIALDEFPEFVSQAAEVITIRIFAEGSFSPESVEPISSFQPQFTHQQFPREKIFGYKSPKLVIDYADGPGLSMRISWSHCGVMSTEKASGSGSSPSLHPPDSIQACLASSLPSNFFEESDMHTSTSPEGGSSSESRAGGVSMRTTTTWTLRSSATIVAPSTSNSSASILLSAPSNEASAAASTATDAGSTPSSPAAVIAWPPGEVLLTYYTERIQGGRNLVSKATSNATSNSSTSSISLSPTAPASASSTRSSTPTVYDVRYHKPSDHPVWAPRLHERMETLAMWLIETASPIDARDPKWSIFTVWERGVGESVYTTTTTTTLTPSPGTSRFVGYCTLFLFTNPFQTPPDFHRLAQLLILPSHSRKGHGLRLLDALLGRSFSCRGPPPAFPCLVREVSIESPCEGMTRLWDLHCLARFASLCGGKRGIGEGGGGTSSSPPSSPPDILAPSEQPSLISLPAFLSTEPAMPPSLLHLAAAALFVMRAKRTHAVAGGGYIHQAHRMPELVNTSKSAPAIVYDIHEKLLRENSCPFYDAYSMGGVAERSRVFFPLSLATAPPLVALSKQDLLRLRTGLLITESQAHRLYEIILLNMVDLLCEDASEKATTTASDFPLSPSSSSATASSISSSFASGQEKDGMSQDREDSKSASTWGNSQDGNDGATTTSAEMSASPPSSKRHRGDDDGIKASAVATLQSSSFSSSSPSFSSSAPPPAPSPEEEALRRSFRLLVKKRLLAADKELLEAEEASRKALLEELFTSHLALYRAALDRFFK